MQGVLHASVIILSLRGHISSHIQSVGLSGIERSKPRGGAMAAIKITPRFMDDPVRGSN